MRQYIDAGELGKRPQKLATRDLCSIETGSREQSCERICNESAEKVNYPLIPNRLCGEILPRYGIDCLSSIETRAARAEVTHVDYPTAQQLPLDVCRKVLHQAIASIQWDDRRDRLTQESSQALARARWSGCPIGKRVGPAIERAVAGIKRQAV